MTDELFEVLCAIGRVLLWHQRHANLDRLIQSSLFNAIELPEAEEAERESPSESHPDQAPLDRTVAP